MTRPLSSRVCEVPLYLIPAVLQRLIRLKGDAVYRISVVRTHWHHYNVGVRTKRIKKELAPVPVAEFAPVPGDAKHVRKSGRRCAA
jgi:hypothetical protein